MPSESKPLLTAQTEKPNHYSYLKEFRVEQCPLFLQHKCTQHRPFTCFHWHFMNQRRRRPVRKRDGSFNYSADNYCTKYDETTGLCPDGDDCPFLHRTAGDTERRYHLRYYKTCMCVHDTDARGYCVKNGMHCAFAHGNHDHRPPVYDIKEIQAIADAEGSCGASLNGPNALDKERNLMNEDPKWQDTNYVLANYKTEACKRPPRLCRQGYACPQYHNSKDKRRSPRKFKYRSTPCPNVKHGEEWGEPANCENGDNCAYCHTRTEQQFHPEIYKSTKCNDVQQAGYCPRGVFCAFAHVEQEMGVSRDGTVPVDCGTSLADILSSALQPTLLDSKLKEKSSDSSNGSGEVSESASTSSLGSNSSHSKAPGAQLSHNKLYSQISGIELTKQIMHIDSDHSLTSGEKEQRKQALYMATGTGSLAQSIVSPYYNTSSAANALDELHLDEALNQLAGLERDLETDSPGVSNPISVGLASSGLLGSSAPVNIPGSSRSGLTGTFSPSNSPLQHLQSNFLSTSRFSHPDPIPIDSFLNHSHSMQSTKIGNSFPSLFDFATQNLSPTRNHNSFSLSPSISNNINNNNNNLLNNSCNSNSLSSNSNTIVTVASGNITSNNVSSNHPTTTSLEMLRLRDELATSRAQLASWEERIVQARAACEAWQKETEDANRKSQALQLELDRVQGASCLHSIRRVSELRTLSLSELKKIQSQLRTDLEEVQNVLYLETATKCMVCEEQNRSVTLPCNHYVLCAACAPVQKECPYCQMPIAKSNATM